MFDYLKTTAMRAAEHPFALISFAMFCFCTICASLPTVCQIPQSSAYEPGLPIVIPTPNTLKSAGPSEPAKWNAAPNVQCIVVGSQFCEPCRALEKSIYDKLTAAGNWKVGHEADSHFRFVSIDDVQRKGIKQTPFVYWVVNGDEIPTTEREPAKLAHEYLRLIGKPAQQQQTAVPQYATGGYAMGDCSSSGLFSGGVFNGRFRGRWFPGRGFGRFIKNRFGRCG